MQTMDVPVRQRIRSILPKIYLTGSSAHKLRMRSGLRRDGISLLCRLEKHKVYLSAILDLYDRRIVAYVIGDSNNNDLVIPYF